MLETKYSVLMSLYYQESADNLENSINSMIKQTLEPDEIIVVYDGELTEDLYTVMNNFQIRYPDLFKIVPLKKNVGLGKALNSGLKASKNEMIIRMDTDDISLPYRCETQVKEMERFPHISILGSHISEFLDNPANTIRQRIVPISHEKIIKFSRRRNPFNHPTVVYKKSEVLSVGGYGDFRRNQDLELFVRMLNNGFIGKNINDSLVLFRADEDSYKRRKSWLKTKSYIKMIYNFKLQGYSSSVDVIIASSAMIIMYILPINIMRTVTDRFLRRKIKGR